MKAREPVYGGIDVLGQRWVILADNIGKYRAYRINQNILNTRSPIVFEHFRRESPKLDKTDRGIGEACTKYSGHIDPTLGSFSSHTVTMGRLPGGERVIGFLPVDGEFDTLIVDNPTDCPVRFNYDRKFIDFGSDFARQLLGVAVAHEEAIRKRVRAGYDIFQQRQKKPERASLVWYRSDSYAEVYQTQASTAFFIHLISTARLAEIFRLNGIPTALVEYDEYKYLQYLGFTGLPDSPGSRSAWAAAEAGKMISDS
jgi:hypothetical protein